MVQLFKLLFGLFFIAGGIGHFVKTEFYLKIMPPYIPYHLILVYLSGICELALGIGLLIPSISKLSAWGLIALLIAVFPANLYMTMNPDLFPATPFWMLVLRLPLQGLMILWAYTYTK